MTLTRIHLEQFTAFEKLKLDVSPGVNVLVGANGTGKTHLMKVAYAACEITKSRNPPRGAGPHVPEPEPVPVPGFGSREPRARASTCQVGGRKGFSRTRQMAWGNCIEFKDPENPAAVPDNREEFVRRFQSGEIDRDLVTKYRDSFLYEWAADHLTKPVHYLVLVAINSLDPAMLLARTDALKQQLPLHGPPNGGWKRKLAAECAVFNMDAWNASLSSFPVKRLGQ